MTRWIAIATVAGAITAVVAAAATIGIDFPKLATQSHVAEHAAKEKVLIDNLAGSVKDTRIIALENAIAADERRAGDLEIQAYQIEQTGQSARAVKDQVNRLRKAVAKRERELNQLRN